jgi:hypothetical protein
MTIPAEIHARLSASERIRAAVSAMARGDDEELQTLKETCSKKPYLMTDPAYSEAMERLLALALAVESDLQAMALDFFLASRLEVPEVVHESVATAAALESAWQEFLAELGIPRHEMTNAGPPRHHAVKTILHLADGEENAAAVQSCLESMRAYLAA